MSFLKGIEGDYIETKKDNLIFDVKGLLHPKDCKICFLRFYPTPQGDRVRYGKNYRKIYDLKQRYQFLKDNFPKYFFYSKELDFVWSYSSSLDYYQMGLDFIQHKEINMQKLISHQFELKEINKAINLAHEAKESLKIIIHP